MINTFMYVSVFLVFPYSDVDASLNKTYPTPENNHEPNPSSGDVPRVGARLLDPVRLNPDWVRSKGNNFTMMALVTWKQARRLCETNGLLLAPIQSQQDQAEFITAYQMSDLPLYDPEGIWLGGSNLEKKAQFVWETRPKVHFSYTNWREGEPNNDQDNEHCTETRVKEGFVWNDAPCKDKKFFACRKYVVY